MRKKDIHSLIEQQNPEVKQEIWEKICSQIDTSELQPKKAATTKPKRWKWAAVALAVVCVVTLSIVLPIVLQDEGLRYCDFEQYVIEELGQTLEKYSFEHDSKLLYVDWYTNAEEVTTSYAHIIDNRNDIVFFKETILNGETGEEIILYITDNRTRVDLFEQFENLNEQSATKGVVVNWQSFNHTDFLTKFEYKGYIYYLELDDSSQDRLTEIITDMLK